MQLLHAHFNDLKKKKFAENVATHEVSNTFEQTCAERHLTWVTQQRGVSVTKKNLTFHCESAWIQARNKEPTAYRHLQEPRLVCSSSRWEQEGIRRAAVANSHGDIVLYYFRNQNLFRIPQSSVDDFDEYCAPVYSQVSRLSLSMCDPDRTVSMSIRRSELRPSGMQGINSSPSDIGSTGIDSCKVIEGASPQSPTEGAQDMEHSVNCYNAFSKEVV